MTNLLSSLRLSALSACRAFTFTPMARLKEVPTRPQPLFNNLELGLSAAPRAWGAAALLYPPVVAAARLMGVVPKPGRRRRLKDKDAALMR